MLVLTTYCPPSAQHQSLRVCVGSKNKRNPGNQRETALLRPGDIFVSVNGEDITALGLRELSILIFT